MAIRTASKTELYVECFYDRKMSVVDISRQFGVSEATVRLALRNHDPEAYQREKLCRSMERRIARRIKEIERKLKSRQNGSGNGSSGNGRNGTYERKKEYIQEEKEAYEWLLWRHSRIFPFKKKRGASDSDLVWFCCASSGLQNILDDNSATKDIKNAIKSACRPVYVPSVECIDEHLNPIGCSKIGKGGGRSDRTARMSLLS